VTGASYLERLGARIAATGAVLCVGLDPHPDELPRGFSRDAEGIARFARLIVEASAPAAAAFKPNLAFFEAFGPAGIAALESVRGAIPEGTPVVIDAKRGDIGSTAARQAVALVDRLRADAVTVNPYLGMDSVEPFLEAGAFAYVLCRTSNPSAGELQDLIVAAPAGTGAPGSTPEHGRESLQAGISERLHERVARAAAGWDAGRGVVGLVVGATAAEELAEVRRVAPALPFIVPGAGAQGGSIEAALRDGPVTAGPAGAVPGGALLVNVSRAIAQAAMGDGVDPGQAVAEAADGWRARLRVLDSIPVSQGESTS
jgi:orotidine-5'-phosphate decarboxylase